MRTRHSARFLGVFALTILVPGGLLAALGVRALIQERRAAGAELEKRLERSTDLVAGAVQRELLAWQAAAARVGNNTVFDSALLPEALRKAAGEPGGLALAAWGPDGLAVWPEKQLLYSTTPQATAPSTSGDPTSLLAEAEDAEIRGKDYATAARLYGAMLKTAVAGDRPGLIHRLARTYRKAGRQNEALARFRELQSYSQFIGAVPAALIATYEICSFSSIPAASDQLRACARDFYRDLVGARWPLEKSRYLFYASTARDWLQRAAPADPDLASLVQAEALKLALTEVIVSLAESGSISLSSRPTAVTVMTSTPHHLVVTWRDVTRDVPHFRAVVISHRMLEADVWTRSVAVMDDGLHVQIAAVDGGVLFQSDDLPDLRVQPPAPVVSRALADRRLPVEVRMWPRDPAALSADLARRQLSYIVMLGLVVLVMGCGAYFTTRLVRQELAVAQLKSDFVSAVSHEFRSPLTGIRQLGEMLVRGRVTSEERRQEYYQRITSESDRLSRLVENLLDFSRMEAGRREYRMEPLEVMSWLRGVAAEFQAQLPDATPEIRTAFPPVLPPIAADREALTCAIQNLLDNAVKYSPGQPTVWLDAERTGGGITIRVRDTGEGIGDTDSARIFETFFRGTDDRTRRVKGAGIGLSLVQHIVSAHGGRVECHSRQGQGTTFSIHIPTLTLEPASMRTVPFRAAEPRA